MQFDGAVNANANSRYWTVSDHYSYKRPYDVGVGEMSYDTEQNWKYLGSGTMNYTECPENDKCIF